ncbi:hypothetical protein CXB51_015020 [Gossypium anomalum]|uniref:Uncharacterized protein n=1 Tax=Gossypium anomalum TaxID=47600 RepID=A0A8J5Z591_9ROSI|nr:hypothetical protein CXB51_015020 [Gossypium anomalum]
MYLSLSLFSCFSSMDALPANSREENSPHEQQQCSNANHMPRPNLNVLLPQPRLLINRPDEIILVPNNFRDPYLSSSALIFFLLLWWLNDDNINDDSDSEYESETGDQAATTSALFNSGTNQYDDALQLEISQIGQEIKNLQRRMGVSVI